MASFPRHLKLKPAPGLKGTFEDVHCLSVAVLGRRRRGVCGLCSSCVEGGLVCGVAPGSLRGYSLQSRPQGHRLQERRLSE